MKITIMNAPYGSLVRRGKALVNFGGVTIHETDNTAPGANAESHGRYMRNEAARIKYGWHYAIDDIQAVQCIPSDEQCIHAGNALGSATTLCLEICVNDGSDRMKAIKNAAQLAAIELQQHGIKEAVWKKNIYMHNDWSGKRCPASILKGYPVNWQEFVSLVNRYLSGSKTNGEHVAIPKLERLLKLKLIKMRGNDVRMLQIRLNLKKYDCGVEDGIFGKKTHACVMQYQAKNKLTQDGIVGSATWAKLWK